MSTRTTLTITEAQKKNYRDEGFMILERAIPEDTLQMLRDECYSFIDKEHGVMDKNNSDVREMNHRGKRYFIAQRYKESARLPEFIYGEEMAEICRATLGPDAYLFYEQWVIKGAEKGMKFGWHQDSGYVGFAHRPYLTCWCALDDMSVANGTAYILPYSRAGTRELQPHTREEGSTDRIGYRGSDPGDPVLVPAGSIAVFSSLTFHRSGYNTTNKMRRVYVVQYVAEPMINPDGSVQGFADPFLKGGEIVR